MSMKKILLFALLSLIMLNVISCNKSKDYVEFIPNEADFVLQVNPKKIAEKGEFNSIEQYSVAKNMISEIEKTSPELKALYENIKNSPTSAGIDIISPLYIFGTKNQGKTIVTLLLNMSDKSTFEEHLKTIYKAIYKREISFTTENGFTFIEGEKKPFLTWDKKKLIFIAGEFGTKTKTLNAYFDALTTNETPLLTNNSFKDFVKNTQDINLWYKGSFISYFGNKMNSNHHDLDLSQSSWSTYISFNNDNVSFTQKFHPDPATKVKIEKRPMWKSKINTDFYKYFPATSYANFSFAVYPKNARILTFKDHIVHEFLTTYGIDPSILENSFEGEMLFSIFDFETSHTTVIQDYFNAKQANNHKLVTPQFALAGKMKDRAFYDHLIQQMGANLKQEGSYYQFRFNKSNSLYITSKNNLLYITNNQLQLTNFLFDRVSKTNFIQSDYSNRAKNPLFAYVNLDMATYPDEVKTFMYQQMPLGQTPSVQNMLNNFSAVQLNVTDEYSKNGALILKNKDKNSLAIVLKLLDEIYREYSNPTMTSYESN